MVFLDTNVFVYAAGAPGVEKDACASLLGRVAAGTVEATTSVEVVQELHHLYRRRGRLADGVRLGQQVLTLIPDALPVQVSDLVRSGEILLARPQLSPRDALHVAVALQHGIATLVSYDADLDAIPEIRRVLPDGVGQGDTTR